MKYSTKNFGYILCIICILYSCSRNINKLNKQEISFDSLPVIVQDTLIALSSKGNHTYPDFIFLDQDTTRYNAKEVKWLGPFTDGFKITDNHDKKNYIINYGIPYPYIIYNGFLFHSLNYNIFYEPTIHTERFMKYDLK